MDPQRLHDSTQGQILAIVIVFPVLALLTVILRLYTRFLVIKSASYEDLCIVIAIVCSIGVSIATCYEVHFGLGKRLAVANVALIGDYFKSLFASIIIYNFALLFTKLSILLQYLRICVPGFARKATFGVMALVTAYGIETFFSGTFSCTPIAFFWDATIPGGHCVDKWRLYFANAGINIVSDFLILLLPVLILKDLQMPKVQKIILICIVSLGGVACIASIFRLFMLHKLSKSADFLWDGPGTATWSAIEVNVGIICASVSTLRPLLSGFMPTIFGSKQSYAPRNQYVTAGKSNKSSKSKADSSTRSYDPFDDEQKLNNMELASHGSTGDIKVLQEYNVERSHV